MARHKLGRLTETIHSVDESKGDLSNLAMASGIYQPKADFCGTGSAVSSHLPEQSVDKDLVKEEAERKLPTASIPSDSFVTKSITSHGQSQHVSVTTTTSTSPLTSNNPEKGMNNKQPILLTQHGPITSNVELSQPSTMPSYLYNRVQWSQPLQHNFDSEPATSASADNPQVTCVSSSLSNVLSTSRHTCPDTTERAMLGDHSARRGKAPPIDLFTAESTEVTFDDWLLTLERAATWNGWTSSEALMQLTGHLKGRALQEWKLLTSEHKISYQAAIKALREKLDPGNQTLAALDFRHTTQKADEPVSDFIGRLEQIFQIGFGREHLSHETRDMLLYGQLQEGLLYTLMESPAVSGAQNYKELCVAAKREERRLAELKRKQQSLKAQNVSDSGPTKKFQSQVYRRAYRSSNNYKQAGSKSDNVEIRKTRPLRCYICDSPEHLARNCRQKNTEAPGKLTTQSKSQKTSNSKVIRTASCSSKNQNGVRCVKVLIEGVPVTGLVDTGSDITIIRGDLFYKIAAVAKVEINCIKNVEQRVCTYDQKPMTLDGCIDMKITFGEKILLLLFILNW